MLNKSSNLTLFLFLCLIAVSCTTKIRHNEAIAPSLKLERIQKIYIGMPQDGSYADITYAGSGSQVVDLLASGARPYASGILTASAYTSVEQVLASAGEAGARYAFIPVITNWEPRRAAWSGRPTRVNMTIMVYDVYSEKRILSRKIDVTGRSFTFVSQSVEELAKSALNQFCVDIFGDSNAG
jgi:hypothetical protein